ncbi:MAG: thermonuclease family protein [Thiobacillus sp.]|nr:thermonuclease family protein [Thiobacillus sp.]
MGIIAAAFLASVIGISDGDTMTVLHEREPVKIRLAEIDAPEKKQPFGTRSKQALSDLCFGKRAEVVPQTKDRYGRTVARVRCEGQDASEQLVRSGMAWVFDRYVIDRGLYRLQDEAKEGRRGLWVDVEPVPPWEWRKGGRH